MATKKINIIERFNILAREVGVTRPLEGRVNYEVCPYMGENSPCQAWRNNRTFEKNCSGDYTSCETYPTLIDMNKYIGAWR